MVALSSQTTTSLSDAITPYHRPLAAPRDEVIAPILAGIRSPRQQRKPARACRQSHPWLLRAEPKASPGAVAAGHPDTIVH